MNIKDLPLPRPVATGLQHRRCYIGSVYTADQLRARDIEVWNMAIEAAQKQSANEGASMNDEVKVLIVEQGEAVCGKTGYMLKRGDDIAAFYLDGWGDTGRIYPVSTCISIWKDGMSYDYPSIVIEDGKDNSSLTEICFPEFEGWRVHSVSGGKTMSICLVKVDS